MTAEAVSKILQFQIFTGYSSDSAREYLTNLVREIYIHLDIRACFPGWAALLTPRRASKSKEKRLLTEGESAMRLSTKGRYAVMAMADLAGNATEAG